MAIHICPGTRRRPETNVSNSATKPITKSGAASSWFIVLIQGCPNQAARWPLQPYIRQQGSISFPPQVVLYTQMYRHSPSPPSSPSSCDTDCLLVCLSYPSNKLTILSFFQIFFRTRNLSVYAKSNIPLVRNGTLRSNPQIVQ